MENCTKIKRIDGIRQVEPIPLSIYVNWPDYRPRLRGEPKVQIPPEMFCEPDLPSLNPGFEYFCFQNIGLIESKGKLLTNMGYLNIISNIPDFIAF